MAVTGRHDDTGRRAGQGSVPWHDRTSALVGVSVAALAAIAVVVASVTFAVRQTGEPERAPITYVEPSGSSADPSSTATTPTATTTPPISTTDIGTGTATTTGSDTSSSTTSAPTMTTSTHRPSADESDGSDASTTSSHRRPRYNKTRTLYPRPVG